MSLSKELLEFLDETFILVVEPNMNYRSTLKGFLVKLGVKDFRLVGSVAEAKREMLTKKIGLFIVEWQLPEKNGLEFCRELRKDKRSKTTPFLLISTENLRDDVILASEGGVSAYLLKPFSFQDFCDQIRLIVESEKNPSQLQSLLERADEYCDQKEFWVAEALYKEALLLKPKSARATCGLGRIELANDNVAKAVALFQQALVHNPEYVDAYKYLLKVAEDQDDGLAILQMAMILHKISPENPKYPLLIASAHMETGNLEESEAYFKRSVRLSPTLAAGYRGLGTVYLKLKDYVRAQKNLEKALDLERADVPTLNSLGLAYVRQKRIDEGIKKYRLALTLDPKDPRVLFNLGLAYELKLCLNDAREWLLRAIAADPKFEKAKRNLDRITKRIATGTLLEGSTGTGDDDESEILTLGKRGA